MTLAERSPRIAAPAAVHNALRDYRVMAPCATHWRFGIAYNAALKLCTILLHASGYRPEKNLAHYRTLTALPLILGDDWADDADYLDTCRSKRNTAEYDMSGVVTHDQAKELSDFVVELKMAVHEWLRRHHPALIGKGERS